MANIISIAIVFITFDASFIITMKKTLYTILAMCTLSVAVQAQDSVHNAAKLGNKDLLAFGLGTGLDYGGGLGLKFAPQLSPNFGFFVAAGLWESRVTANVGIKLRVLAAPQSNFSPYFMAMYGSNEVLSRVYVTKFGTGLSAGAGIDLLNRPNSFGYISLGANYAFTPKVIYLTIGLNAILVKGR